MGIDEFSKPTIGRVRCGHLSAATDHVGRPRFQDTLAPIMGVMMVSVSVSVMGMLVCVVAIAVDVDVTVVACGSSTCIGIHPATVKGRIEWAYGWM